MPTVAACGPSRPAEVERSVGREIALGHRPVFTPAHASVGEALRAFFDRPTDVAAAVSVQPPDPLSKGAICTDCHEGVETGPRAGLPSINTCMICHSQIATDRPLIQQMTAMQEKGVDLAWQRVYDYFPESHVRFDHAPHIRAKVECSTCHGNQAEQTVAVRAVNMDMAFCVNCHSRSRRRTTA